MKQKEKAVNAYGPSKDKKKIQHTVNRWIKEFFFIQLQKNTNFAFVKNTTSFTSPNDVHILLILKATFGSQL